MNNNRFYSIDQSLSKRIIRVRSSQSGAKPKDERILKVRETGRQKWSGQSYSAYLLQNDQRMKRYGGVSEKKQSFSELSDLKVQQVRVVQGQVCEQVTKMIDVNRRKQQFFVVSNRNRRFISSYLLKYGILQRWVLERGELQQKFIQLIEKFNRQEVEYAEILKRSQKRLVPSIGEQEYIHNSVGNVKLRKDLQRDLQRLIVFAKQSRISLFRNKIYEPLGVVRSKLKRSETVPSKKIEHTNVNTLLIQQQTNREKISRSSKEGSFIQQNKKQIVNVQQRAADLMKRINVMLKSKKQESTVLRQLLGKSYLQQSRRVGRLSIEVQKQQKGSVRLIKEIIHQFKITNCTPKG